jgi:hypothetical protein
MHHDDHEANEMNLSGWSTFVLSLYTGGSVLLVGKLAGLTALRHIVADGYRDEMFVANVRVDRTTS